MNYAHLEVIQVGRRELIVHHINPKLRTWSQERAICSLKFFQLFLLNDDGGRGIPVVNSSHVRFSEYPTVWCNPVISVPSFDHFASLMERALN